METKHTVRHIEAFVLAGGESSRMGRDKALLDLGGVTLIARTLNLIMSIADQCTIVGEAKRLDSSAAEGAAKMNWMHVIADDFPGAGPLGGIAAALRAARSEWNLIVACDLPYLTREWLEFLVAWGLRSDADVVLPMNERGAEPLCGMYRKRAETAIREALARGTRKVTDGLAEVHTEFIELAEWKPFDSDGLLFKNMNSPADYEEAKARFNASAKR